MRNIITPKETIERIEAMIDGSEGSGLSQAAIARACNVDPAVVRAVQRGQHFYQQTPEEQARRSANTCAEAAFAQASGGRYLPTPEEIRAACLAIHDRDQRAGYVREEDRSRHRVRIHRVALADVG